ncbi:MAG: PocR ligand-binding domain-containing protein [Eubacteriales bacterium]|nr:PocR ligand-binding domain-containing protein [Clostridiales bacterium]MDY3941683.1 PocR ligand-binding domain-containing protein [Eubacteriales bacterium]
MQPKNELLFNKQALDQFALALHRLTGFHVGLHNRDYSLYAAAGDDVRNFCAVCRNHSPAFFQNCLKCDNAHLKKVLSDRRTTAYTCPFGLSEIIIPLMWQEELVGYIFLGQAFRDAQPEFEPLWEKLLALDEANLYPHREEIRRAFENTQCLSEEKMTAAIQLGEIFAAHTYAALWFSQAANANSRERFSYYLSLNDWEHMPIAMVSAASASEMLHISYSQLNRIARAVVGMPFKQYVLDLKLRAAVRMLDESDLPLSGIAQSLGFDDAHYFARLLRRFTGKSCRQLRENEREGQRTAESNQSPNGAEDT